MPSTLSLRCSCGKLRGSLHGLSPSSGNRLVCMCDDCQAYAGVLGQAETILDSHGGTDIYQTTPSQLRIESGHDEIQCLRLTPKGLFRWHTRCCHTPVANTMPTAGWPFVGIPTVFIDHASEDELARIVGPIRARIHSRFCPSAPPENAHPKFPLSSLARLMTLMARWRLKQMHRPSPFFDDDGMPVAHPRVVY